MAENIEKKYEKPVFEYIPTEKIEIPSFRVTAEMPEDLREQFEESIKKAGIKNPLKIIYEKGHYYLVDGLHRLQEAKLANIREVPCVVVKSTLGEAVLENLATGKLQGRGKATDMIRVVKYLAQEQNMTLEEIALKSGYKLKYLEDLMSIANAHPDLLTALDDELIPLGAAVELAKIPNPDSLLRLLYEVIYRRMKVEDVRNVVKMTLEQLELKKKEEKGQKTAIPRDMVPIACWVCGEEAPARDMATFVLCPVCQNVLFAYKAELRARMKQPAGARQEREEGKGEGGQADNEEKKKYSKESKSEVEFIE